jgi:hypothetical protein
MLSRSHVLWLRLRRAVFICGKKTPNWRIISECASFPTAPAKICKKANKTAFSKSENRFVSGFPAYTKKCASCVGQASCLRFGRLPAASPGPLVSTIIAKTLTIPNKTKHFRFVSLKKPLLQVVYFEQYIKTDQLINHPPSIVRVSSSISPHRGSMLVAFPIPKKCARAASALAP